MKPVSAFQYFCLAHFGKPVEDREIYKTIRKHKFRSIVEIGLGDGTRAEKMLRVAAKFSLTDNLRYTGIDLFEGREGDQPKLLLRQVHKQLSSCKAKIQLVPGELHPALVRVANSHVRTDLILISAGQDEESLASCWFYFPRMLHAGSQFMIQDAVGQPFRTLSRLEIEKMADKFTTNTRRAAA